jgi:hypothetical protein
VSQFLSCSSQFKQPIEVLDAQFVEGVMAEPKEEICFEESMICIPIKVVIDNTKSHCNAEDTQDSHIHSFDISL